MAAVTTPGGSRLPQITNEHAVREWLDALAIGTCDQAAFLHAMQDRFQSDKDGNWEVLSLLDQYYRRGKIKADVFHAIKTSLAGTALGADENQIARTQPRPSSIVTAPVFVNHQIPKSAPADAARLREIKVGDVLRQRYRILGVVGQGGMGTVFEAVDEFARDPLVSTPRIAIKVLHTEVTRRAELLQELQREFQNLKLLSHPNIVRVHEFDRDGVVAFFTMELLSGVLLSRVISVRRGVPFDRSRSWSMFHDVASAVAHAHSRGVVHGDINPQNIFVTRDGAIRVLDFGASNRVGGGSLTAAPEITPFATPGYASCEVLEGRQPDARDDIFAVACVAYLLLTGSHPYGGSSSLEARASRLKVRRPAALSGQQWRALQAGLSLRRDKRPANTQQWLDRFGRMPAVTAALDVSDLLQSPPVRQLRLGRWAAIAALILLALGGSYWLSANPAAADFVKSTWDGAKIVVGQLAGQARREAPLPAIKAPLPDSIDEARASRMPAPAPAPAPQNALQPTAPQRAAGAGVAAVSPARAPPSAAGTPGNSGSDRSAPENGAPANVAAIQSKSSHPSAAWPARIEMVEDAIDVPASDAAAQVTVKRRSNLHGDVSFSWWTESGTAKPGTDFSAVAPHEAHILDGKNGTVLSVPLASNLRSKSKSFYVVIDQSEPGAIMGGKTLTMVTLLPSDN